MGDKTNLKDCDLVACEILNSLRDKHNFDIAEACQVVAIIWGRLRKAAEEAGANPIALDTELLFQADIFTKALDSEGVLKDT